LKSNDKNRLFDIERAKSYSDELGWTYRLKGNLSKSIENSRKALDTRLFYYVNEPNHPNIARSYDSLGAAYGANGEYDTAIDYHQKALKIEEKIYADNLTAAHPDLALSYNNLGVVYDAKSEPDLAIYYHQKANEIFKKIHANNQAHPLI
jgi:tetratricopeptide (TPR) repeat protein